MKRTSFVFALMTVAGFLTAGTSVSAQAGNDRSPTASVGSNSKAARAVTRRLKLYQTRISSECCGIVAVAGGFQPLDGTSTLPCPAVAVDCVIVAEQNVQMRSATAGNNWAICTQVDGVFLTNPSCPFLGPPAFLSTFITNSSAQSSGALAPGAHNVQTFIYTDAAADRGIYEITYSLYY